VGFSGGKDSTTSIILLKRAGFEVSAVTMQLGLGEEREKLPVIRDLADILEVPLHIVDFREKFRSQIIDSFVDGYASGFTPNPCALCNVKIKFDLLMEAGKEAAGGELFATGHYADKTEINGRFFLKEPADRVKSQIYFLSMIGPDRLKNVIFPISSMDVSGVRQLVRELPLGNSRESQDVCFLSGMKLIDFLKEEIPEAFREGDILDVEGEKIGRHGGAVNFTIGQRRGTGFSSAGKMSVVRKDMKNNTITLGGEEHLYSEELSMREPVFWTEVRPGERYRARIRYLSRPEDITVTDVQPDLIKIRFDNPVKSITPGQICALYEGDIIVAAGLIEQGL